ncbi:MAG TPA: DUF5668 domain-containing protein [Candidatus Dormibacteraeota bacterium]
MSDDPPQQLPPPQPSPWGRGTRYRSRSLWFPVALVVVGVVALLDQFGLLWWMRWEILWPLVLIAIGVALIIRRWR